MRKIGLREMARRVRVDKDTISFLERGKHSTNMFTLIDIAKELDVSIDYLAYGGNYGNYGNHISEEPAATHAAGR
jgi:transcriptional regulator with XRE-family HTH domain